MPEKTHSGKIGDLWCAIMHASPAWPIHGKYHCRTCGRRYLVPWATEKKQLVTQEVPAVRQTGALASDV